MYYLHTYYGVISLFSPGSVNVLHTLFINLSFFYFLFFLIQIPRTRLTPMEVVSGCLSIREY